jgi:hypothetical protein
MEANPQQTISTHPPEDAPATLEVTPDTSATPAAEQPVLVEPTATPTAAPATGVSTESESSQTKTLFDGCAANQEAPPPHSSSMCLRTI